MNTRLHFSPSALVATSLLLVMLTAFGAGCSSKAVKKGNVTIKDNVVISSDTKLPAQITAQIKTEKGNISLKLYPQKAPLAVENFVTHAKKGYYNGVVFHRVLEDFMIQGGDPTGTGLHGESIWGVPFVNEIDDSLGMFRGSLAMANKSNDKSNTSQFFIVQTTQTVTDEMLDEAKQQGYEVTDAMRKKYVGKQAAYWLDGGYTIFGTVTNGMDVVDQIAAQPLSDSEKGTPATPVKILSVTIDESKD